MRLGQAARTLVPWRQGFRHLTRKQINGLFHPNPLHDMWYQKLLPKVEVMLGRKMIFLEDL